MGRPYSERLWTIARRCSRRISIGRCSMSYFRQDRLGGLLEETLYTQPALFSVEYALAELWRSWGVEPNILLGHSVGEYVAACIAGVFSLEDGLALIALRGRLMQSLPAGGAMAAIFAPYETVAEAIRPHASEVSIASANGPNQTVISGRVNVVDQICEKLGKGGIGCKPLPVSHAFHSPLVEPVLDRFEAAVSNVVLSPPRLRLVSNLTGLQADASEIVTPLYWRRHMRESVRFGDGVRALEAARTDCCIEIGPTPALLPLAAAAFETARPTMIPSLRRNRPDWEQMVEGLSAVYLAGRRVDWRGLSDQGRRRIVDLPGYPFQRKRYWFRARPKSATKAISRRPEIHPLLGHAMRSPAREKNYQSVLSANSPSFIRQHRVAGRIVLPATAYLEILGTIARREFPTGSVVAENVTIGEAMLLEDNGAGRLVNTSLEHSADASISVSISSAALDNETGAWTEHVTAKLRREAEQAFPQVALDQNSRRVLGARSSRPVLSPARLNRVELRRRVQVRGRPMARSRASPRSYHAVARLRSRARRVWFSSGSARWMSSSGRGLDRFRTGVCTLFADRDRIHHMAPLAGKFVLESRRNLFDRRGSVARTCERFRP